MTEKPLVSVIVPTFNGRPWLEQALESARAQTYRSIEIIVVDDGSTDGTAQWAASRYGDSIALLRQVNSGVAAARNAGIACARGAYIQFLDADDLLPPGKIAQQVAFLESDKSFDGVYCDIMQFHGDDVTRLSAWPRRERFQSGDILSSIIDSDYLLPHALLLRREAVDRTGPFDPTLPSNEDWDWFLRLARTGACVKYLPGQHVLYRLHGSSRSQRRVEHSLSGVLVLRNLEQSIDDAALRARLGIRRAIGSWQFAHGRALAETGSRLKGCGWMTRGLFNDGRHLHYKLSFIAFTTFWGASRAAKFQTRLQSVMRRIG